MSDEVKRYQPISASGWVYDIKKDADININTVCDRLNEAESLRKRLEEANRQAVNSAHKIGSLEDDLARLLERLEEARSALRNVVTEIGNGGDWYAVIENALRDTEPNGGDDDS